MPAVSPQLHQPESPIVKHHEKVSDYSTNPPASIFARFAASVVDALFSGVLTRGLAILAKILLGENKILELVITLALGTAYAVYPLVKWGFSPGKRLLGLRVIRTTGSPDLTTWIAIKREFIGKFLSVVCVIGFFMPFFNKRKMALHDYVAGTQVIKDDE